MNILISGATGLIGSALKEHLQQAGHSVYLLHRGRSTGSFYWNPENNQIHLDENIHLDAAVCLNGVNIGDHRWSQQRKQDIVNSRVQCTRLLSSALAKRFDPPEVFVSGSAIGFYGDTGDQIKDETDGPGQNFLSDIVTQWEAAAQPALDKGIRTVFIRSGVVLSPDGGALKKMLLPFKLGLGGKVGNGSQFMSWISLLDEIRAIQFVIEQASISGPVNITAPNPVTNDDFTQALGKALNRPTVLPMPELIVKLLFGEMGELLLLGSNRINSQVLQKAGFKFEHKTVGEALSHMLMK